MWKEHFQQLLGNPTTIVDKPVEKVFDTLQINTEEFTTAELKTAIKTLQNNKATRLDEIPAEVWKTECLDQELLEVCNKTFHGDAPDIWRKGGLLPFPKKGNLAYTKNYRGITLSAVASKIYNKMLLNRMKPFLDPLLRKNQNGFRPGRSTIAQILSLRRIVEGIKAKNLPVVITFVDFKKAFDSIHRGKLMDILLALSTTNNSFSSKSSIYQHISEGIITRWRHGRIYDCCRCTSRRHISSIPVYNCIRLCTANCNKNEEAVGFTLEKARSRRYPSKILCDTDFADDIALLSNTLEQAQLFLLMTEQAVAQVGLQANVTKTEYMMYNQPEGDLVTLNSGKLKMVDDFQYLGSRIASTEKDIIMRIGKAWSALQKLNVIWKSRPKRQLKINLFRATVETVLAYDATTWTLTKSLTRRIDRVYTRMLRAALDESWKTHTTNKELYGNIPPISQTIIERRLQLSGHCLRATNEVISEVILWEPTHGKRGRGRPARTYIDQLVDDTGIQKEHLCMAMEDREGWRGVIKTF